MAFVGRSLGCVALFLLGGQAACATATLDDDPVRGVEPDGGPSVKPPLSIPDAAVIEVVDAAPSGDPDAADCPVADLLANGNFDSGAGAPWVETSTGDFPLVLVQGAPEFPDTLEVPADSGTFLAYLGGYNEGTDVLGQDLALPADAADLRLAGVFQLATAETADRPFDVAFVEVATTEGEVLEELTRLTNQDAVGVYTPFEGRAAGRYGGQTVRVQIRVVTDDSRISHFFFDTLVFEAKTCAASARSR